MVPNVFLSSSTIRILSRVVIDQKNCMFEEGGLKWWASVLITSCFQDKMYQDEYQVVLSEEERQQISSKLSEASTWMDEEGYTAATKELKEKLSDLKKLCKSMFFKVEERRKWPDRLAALDSMLNHSSFFLKWVLEHNTYSFIYPSILFILVLVIRYIHPVIYFTFLKCFIGFCYEQNIALIFWYRSARLIPEDDQIFTEVELKTLEKIINETTVCKYPLLNIIQKCTYHLPM